MDKEHPIDRHSFATLSHPEKLIWVEQTEREKGYGTFDCVYCGRPFQAGTRREFMRTPGIARRAGARFCTSGHAEAYSRHGPRRIR